MRVTYDQARIAVDTLAAIANKHAYRDVAGIPMNASETRATLIQACLRVLTRWHIQPHFPASEPPAPDPGPPMDEAFLSNFMTEFMRRAGARGLSAIDLARLRERMEMGLRKYGRHAFQASRAALDACPLEQHAAEEWLDMLAYQTAMLIRDGGGESK